MEGSDCLYVYFCHVHLEVIDILLNGCIYINLVNRNITLTVQFCQLPGLRLVASYHSRRYVVLVVSTGYLLSTILTKPNETHEQLSIYFVLCDHSSD
jgi:hypothetical protein